MARTRPLQPTEVELQMLKIRLSAERENCCDDLVVAKLGNRFDYGRALLAIEELRGRSTVLAVGASDSSLLARVRRIAGLEPDRVASSPWPILSFALGLVGVALMLSLLSFQSLAQTPEDADNRLLETELQVEMKEDAVHFTDEQRVELKRAAAHGDGWYFVDLDRGRLATPPFAVEIDTLRLPYFVVRPKEEELNAWLVQEGIDLILYSHAKPLGDGSGAMNQQIQIRSVRTNLKLLATGLQQQADKSWTWKTLPHDVVSLFERKDETTHVSGFVPDSSSGEVRADSPVPRPFRTAGNVIGLFLLEQPQPLKDELTLRIVHVAGATTPLADVEYATGDFVSGKNGPAKPPGVSNPMVAELADGVRPGEWPMWGGSPHRNHVAGGRMPTDWDLKTGRNVLWKTQLGTQTYSSPVVSGGKIFIGTNNGAELDPRRAKVQDLSCLVCLDQTTGEVLWQYASEKLPTGRVHDWPEIGLCSTACVVNDRLWVVTNRCEVLCLDTDGFRDGENDGSIINETNCTEIDADVVWKFDMFNMLGVRPLHQAVSSIAVVDGLVLLNTSNSSSESRDGVPAPKAPNFLALDASTGRVVWQDNSAGESIVVGGSSCGCPGTSPTVATIGGVTQAIFAGREGWLYGFDFADLKQGKTTRLWNFDCNPKTSKYTVGGGSTRNTLVASPVVVGNYVFIATGRDPEQGEGAGDLWCIDATKRGDISNELVFNNSHLDGREPIAHKPRCACDPKQGDYTRPNPNSGAIWHYVGFDRDGDGKLSFEESFHRSLGSPAIYDGLLFIADYSGLVHCIDARTGEALWVDDLFATVWSSCVIADGKVLITDEDGNVTIYRAARNRQRVHGDDAPNFGASIYSTPAVANDTLFVATKDTLVAMRGRHVNADASTGGPQNAAQETDPAQPKPQWGNVLNGLRARVVPVLSSMSEDAIDLAHRVDKFEKPDDVAFAVELENVSDKPIRLLDTRYGSSFGDSSGKAHSNWYGQFLFSIDLFDREGKLIEQPEVEVVTLDSVLGSVGLVTVEPGKTHRFLLRPSKWLSVFQRNFEPGNHHVAVRYHGMPPRVVTRIKEYKAESPVFASVAGGIVTPPVAFEVRSLTGASDIPKETVKAAKDRAELVWGEPANGVRAAMSFAPSTTSHAHGEKPKLNIHVQNISDAPITVASQLWMSELGAHVQDENGEPVEVSTAFYTGRTPVARVTLKPQQIAVFYAGNIGLAITGERAGNFEHVTNRRLVAPAGKYTMQLSERFGSSFLLKDGKGKVLAPLDGDYVGELKTGGTPFEITNEVIECNIIDAVSGEPVVGTTVNFRFIKPKSGDKPEEIVADMFWGPQSPSRIVFGIPDDVLQRAGRDEIEIEWSVGGHADYEPYAPKERISLKPFFHEGTKAARETLGTIKLTKKADGVPEKKIQFRLLGGDQAVPLSDVEGEVTNNSGSVRETFGLFRTDEAGTAQVELPPGGYRLQLKSAKDLPYLLVDKAWNRKSRGPRPLLLFSVSNAGVRKWEGEHYVAPDDSSDPWQVTFTLLPACELELQAIDVDTGKGVPGVEFFRENAVGEDWAHPIPGENLGWLPVADGTKFGAAGNSTNSDGIFRRLVGANAGFKYGIWKSPAGYEEVEPRRDVEIDIVYGQRKAEHIFKLRRVQNPDDAHGADNQAKARKLRGPAFVLPDHLNVMAVGFDGDGKELVSVATEHAVTVRTWDVVEQKLKREVKLDSDKHGNFFLTGRTLLSADGRRVAAIVSGQVGVWDATTGALVKMLELPQEMQNGFLRGLAITPDLSLVAVGRTPGFGGISPPHAHGIVWDVASGKVLRTVQHNDAVQVQSIALSHDGKWLATGGQEAGTCVWEVGTGKRLLALPNENPDHKHPDPKVKEPGASQVLCLAFSPDGRQLAIGDMLGVKLVDAVSGRLEHQLDASYRLGRSGLVFSQDGQLLARTATDKVVPIWSTQTGRLLTEIHTEAHDGVFSPDGRWFAVGLTDKEHGLAVWQLRDEPGAVAPEEDAAAKELELFQRNWAMDLCDSETKDFGDSQEVVRNWRCAIHENEIKWTRSNGEIWKLKFKIDSSKSPKEIDLTFLDGPHKGETCLGMYEWGGVNKTMLMMSVLDPGAKVARPTSISMQGGGQTSLIFLQPVPPDETKRELASLQGTWKFDMIQTDGWPKTSGKGPERNGHGDDLQWVIKGNEITRTSRDGEEAKLSFTIDPTKAPKHIDVTFLSGPQKGRKCQGMYERGGLNGVMLYFCMTDPGSQAPRPTDVSYSTNEGRTMIGLIRVEQPDKPTEKPAESGVQAPLPLLEFRFAAQPADGKLEPRVPADYAQRDYSGNSVIGRMVAKDNGFIWVPVAESKDRVSAMPVERSFGDKVREVLLADTPDHAMAWTGKWSVEECRVRPDPNGDGRFLIELKLNEAGGTAMRALTKSHLNQPLAILVNNEIIAAPIVQDQLGRDIVITGNFNREQADALVKAIVPAQQQDAEAPGAASEESAKSGLIPGQLGGVLQTMRIDLDGSITYTDVKTLCLMRLFEDDRLQIAFENVNHIWTEVTLPLVIGADGQQRAAWSAELDGYVYRATAIPFSPRGCLFRLEKRRDDKLVHGSLQFFAVKRRQGEAKHDASAKPIDHRQWRVDQSGTGIVAGSYTGASQPMQIAEDGTISYADRPHGICHLSVSDDNRLTAAFRDARGMPTEITLTLVTTAAEQRASWSAEVDGHTLRATAIPYSDNVYVFRLEKLRDGKLIEGEEQFYAIDQKLRKATPEERAGAKPAS